MSHGRSLTYFRANSLCLQNLRSLASAPAPSPSNSALLPGGLRTDNSWRQEVEQCRLSGEYRSQLSSRFITGNKELQAAAQQQIDASITKVESAIQSKLTKTQMLIQTLEQALSSVDQELAGLSRSQQRLKTMMAHVKQKAGVNQSRQQVRCERPARECTHDEVSRTLVRQQDLLANLLERLQRGLAVVMLDTDKLTNCRQQLKKDLKDKVDSLQVDELVLAVKPGHASAPTGTAASTKPEADVAHSAATSASRASSGGKCSHSWEQQTTSLVHDVHQLASASGRLRKAVKQLLQEAQTSSQQMTQQLNGAMASKLQSTDLLKAELNLQLHKVQEECNRATGQRNSLHKSLHDKIIPMQQLEARYNIRAAHPGSAAVDDEVQYALAAEAAQLSGVCAQLTQRVVAADAQIMHLNELTTELVRNIADKEAAMTLEEKVTMMDGRLSPAVPPTSPVFSACSSVASGYSDLGDSASQVASRVTTPAARGQPATTDCRSSPSRLGASPTRVSASPTRVSASKQGCAYAGSRAGSGYLDSSSAIAKIAALEQELAQAKVETEHLHNTIHQLKLSESRPLTPACLSHVRI